MSRNVIAVFPVIRSDSVRCKFYLRFTRLLDLNDVVIYEIFDSFQS